MSNSTLPNGDLSKPGIASAQHESHTSPFPPLIQNDVVNVEEDRSSASGSWKSWANGNQNPPRKTSIQDANSRSDSRAHNANDVSRRRSQRHSGGFLLNPLAASSPRLLKSMKPRSSVDDKGKRRSDESELHVAKRRSRDSRNTPTASLASSLQVQDAGLGQLGGLTNGNGEAGVTDGAGLQELKNSHANSNGDLASRDGSTKGSSHVGGYDSDPLQIVNMALSLSQARRRQASLRYVSGGAARQRGVSIATSNASPQKSPELNRFVEPTHEITTNSSPIKLPISPPSRLSQTVTPPPEKEDQVMVDVEDDLEELSPATVARVQKAKTFFELAYEHRRLLSHLPPVRDPHIQVSEADPTNFSKAYNPLQFIRDRKFRIWDDTPINAEADGWRDINKVRAWVDAVVSTSTTSRHAPDESIRLPPLDLNEFEEDEDDYEETSPMQSTGQLMNPKPGKLRIFDGKHTLVRRPGSDWLTHPGDMIANAFWLEQGQNKLKILDRDDRQIYPPDTQLKRVGWRNRTPMALPDEFIKDTELAAANVAAAQQSSSPPPVEQSPSPERHRSKTPQALLPDLPKFKSAREKLHDSRLSRRLKKRSSSASPTRRSGSIRRGLGIFKSSDSESTASDNEEAEEEASHRGRKRTTTKRQKVNLNGEAVQQEQDVLAPLGQRGTESLFNGSSRSNLRKTWSGNRKGTGFSRLLKVGSNRSVDQKNGSPMGRIETRADSEGPSANRRQVSRTPRHSLDQGVSPVIEWPSIAANLSPPASRSPSPVKRVRSSILSNIREKPRKRTVDRITTGDVTENAPLRPRRSVMAANDSEKYASDSSSKSRGESRERSPTARGISPTTQSRRQSIHESRPLQDVEEDLTLDHRASTASRFSTKTGIRRSAEHPNKIRGIFKGGRIAEIVGTEVSRVGDFILKREPPPEYRHHGSTSTVGFGGSDEEPDAHLNGHIHKTPPYRVRPSRASTASSDRGSRTSPEWSRTSLNSPPGQYHNVNLPTFTSPFQKDQEKAKGLLSPADASPISEEADHISEFAAEYRRSSRSSRMERLAPPRLDTSRSPSRHRHSADGRYSVGGVADLGGPQDASTKLNDALQGSLMDGRRFSRPGGDLNRRISEVNLEITDEADENNVTRRDISRAEALLFSSVVKAREIGRRANRPQAELPQFLLVSLTPENKKLHESKPLQIRPRDQYFVAAQNIVTILSGHATHLQTQLDDFSRKTTPNLHAELQKLEDRLENDLAPRVRKAGDQAGELSVRLNTTSTRAVKELNDMIESAFRLRMYGPLRFARNMWFSMVEWAVVGLLWAIWAFVTIVKVVLGVFKIGFRGVRWLLWID